MWINGDYAVNNVSHIGVANSSSGNTHLSYKLKTVKRYQGTASATDLSAKVEGEASHKWLRKANSGSDTTKFYTVGTKAKITDSTTAIGSGTRHTVNVVVVVPRLASTLKLNKIATGDATSSSAFLSQAICLLEKTTADAADCPAPVAPATDPLIPEAEAKFFLQVATAAANANTSAYAKVMYDGEWAVTGACATTALATCKNYSKTFGNEASAAADLSTFWATESTQASGWKVAYDTKATGNATEATLNKAKSVTGVSNKVTPWVGTTAATIKVSTDMAKANMLGDHTSVVTYGWTVTTMTKANLQATGIKGNMITTDNVLYKVRVEGDVAVNKIAFIGVGANAPTAYLSWKLKTIKRYKGSKSALDLSVAVTANSAIWGTKANNDAVKKFYSVGVKAKISANEATGTKTDHISSTIVVVPRLASTTKLHEVTVGESSDASSFLSHSVCLREKTTAAVTCPTGKAPVVGIAVSMKDAKFFNQIGTVANGNKDAYDKVEWASEWDVVGDCTTATTMGKCKLFKKSFGAEASQTTLSDFWVTRNNNGEGFHVSYDAKPLANATAKTIEKAKNLGSMTNKVTLWVGNVPKIKVESSAKKTDSLNVHPSTTTYGWTVTTMTSANLINTSRIGYLHSPTNTKLRIRADNTYAAGLVTSLGV